VLLMPIILLAASGGEGAEAASPHVSWFNVLGKVFNSTILFGGLILLLRKQLIAMLSNKSAAIEKDFSERQKSLAETTVRLEEIEQRLQKVKTEMEQIKASAEASGREELARLEAAGREEAARIIALSDEEIRLRVEAALRQIKGHIADLAIAHFREDFIKNLDPATQQKIIERNIAACGDIDEGK
ncbi:MAG: ATP synthase F0 subunit B, partial [Candidatus Aminicenantes bacterium]|nr:ATP synthase F0 subunit B [Candidatus Aminicenantes bacterium]